MRKENESIKKKYSLQIQDLRRQLVTKKAFDEDESQREISRLKKELHFVNNKLFNAQRRGTVKENISSNMTQDSSKAAFKNKVRSDLEEENEALMQKIDEMEANSKSQYMMEGTGRDMASVGKSILESEMM